MNDSYVDLAKSALGSILYHCEDFDPHEFQLQTELVNGVPRTTITFKASYEFDHTMPGIWIAPETLAEIVEELKDLKARAAFEDTL